MKNCVYRFLNKNNEVIYVGRSKDLKQRINQHFSNSGHLKKECYKETETIEFLKCDNELDMHLKEIYFINKYKPKYNTKELKEGECIINDFNNLNWLRYKLPHKKSREEELIEENARLKSRIMELEIENRKNLIDNFNNKLDMNFKKSRTIKQTIRVDEAIWRDFSMLCASFPFLKKQDIISKALLNFIKE